MQTIGQEETSRGTRAFYFLLLLSQTFGLVNTINIPSSAIDHGALGYTLVYVMLYVLLGIPLLYMELIIGQFTGLDSIDVWSVRPFLSRLGYITIFWQSVTLLYNHIMVSYTFYYFLITFENPVPYYTCGDWATKDCDILLNNFTINQDCIKSPHPFDYCDKIYTTFPEYQYWRFVTLKGNKRNEFLISWRVCLPSGIACVVLYLSCFKRKQSVKWFLGALTLYPTLAYLIFMLGSMVQKGVVIEFPEAFDVDWSILSRKFNFTSLVAQLIYSLGLGMGLAVNLGASCPFRSPSYANATVAVVIGAALTLLAVCTTIMMACPYAYRYGISPNIVLHIPMTLAFERIPRMLREYEDNNFWAIILLSCQTCLGLRTVVLIFFNLLEVLAAKFTIVAKYPGIATICGVVALFCFSLPFFGPSVIVLQASTYRRHVRLLPVVFVLIEIFVFILWYGLDRFCEDVHFMQGIRPRAYLKLTWVISSILLFYILNRELYANMFTASSITTKNIGFWILSLSMSLMVVSTVVALSVSICRKQFWVSVNLSRAWKPRSEVLQRSRAMFSAQAMTKEYLYRQYHLQAGVVARQKRANNTLHNHDPV